MLYFAAYGAMHGNLSYDNSHMILTILTDSPSDGLAPSPSAYMIVPIPGLGGN